VIDGNPRGGPLTRVNRSFRAIFGREMSIFDLENAPPAFSSPE
jgi:hypothetical protein